MEKSGIVYRVVEKLANSKNKLNLEDGVIINTSNDDKLRELVDAGLVVKERRSVDLKEVESDDPLTVVLHKAKEAGENVLVEDTSLEVAGLKGTEIKFLLDKLHEFEGKPARVHIYLGILQDGYVYTATGTVEGKIVEPRGHGGFGFDPYFMPNDSKFTLGEKKENNNNARYKAVKNILDNKVKRHKVPEKWEGDYQNKGV